MTIFPSVPGGREVFSRSATTSRTHFVVQGPHARRCPPDREISARPTGRAAGRAPVPNQFGARPDKRVFPSEVLPVPKEKGPAWPRRGARRFPPPGVRRTRLPRSRGGSPRARGGDLSNWSPQSAAFFHNRAISDNNKQTPTTLFTLSIFLSHPRREHLLASLPVLGASGSADRSPSRERPSTCISRRARTIRALVHARSLRRPA